MDMDGLPVSRSRGSSRVRSLYHLRAMVPSFCTTIRSPESATDKATSLSSFLPFYSIIIIMYSYHALINALGAHMIHINLNMIFCTHVEHSPTKRIYIKNYMEKQTHTRALVHTHTHMHKHTHACTHKHIHMHTHTHKHTHTHIHSTNARGNYVSSVRLHFTQIYNAHS